MLNGELIEECFISCLLNKPAYRNGKIKSFYFTDKTCGRIYKALEEGYTELPDISAAADVPLSVLMELQDMIRLPTQATFDSYGMKILEAYKNKEFSAVRDNAPDGEVIDRLEEIKSLQYAEEINPFAEFVKEVEIIATGKPDSRVVPTYYTYLDECIKGFRKDELVIIGGRPGSGKTTFALNMAYNMATQGKRVVFFSLEMSAVEFLDRLTKQALEISEYNMSNCEKVIEFARKIESLPLKIIDNGATSIEDIANVLRHTKCDIAFVDHLSILKSNRRYNSRLEELSDITRRLKVCAKQVNIPLVCLCQLNRQLESRDIKAPALADLRDSGTIEQDADLVGFIYRPEYHLLQMKPDTGEKLAKWQEVYDKMKGKAQFILAKNRRGVCKRFNFNFTGEYYKFTETE